MQTAEAKLKFLKISPTKVRLVVDLVRGKKVEEALKTLKFLNKISSKPVLKLIESAKANAMHNHNMKKESLR
jgi:large subunit ribosomal protein L22